MFSLEQYKVFIQKQVIGKAYYRKLDVTNQLLEALYQFDIAPGSYLAGITDVSKNIKLYLTYLIKNQIVK